MPSSAVGVLDQVVLSAGGLAMNVMLARWLSPEGYGVFTMAQVAMIFFSGIYNALIIEPMTILGARRFGGMSRPYFSVMLAIHGILSTGLVLVLGGLWVLGRWGQGNGGTDGFGQGVLGVAVATPLLLLLWLWRRRLYVQESPTGAFLASSVYGVWLLAGIVALRAMEALTLCTSFIAIAVASTMGSLAAMAAARTVSRRSSGDEGRHPVHWRETLGKHWHYGRWAALASILYWAIGYLYYYLVGLFVGLTEVATLRVAVMLFQPVQTLQSGLTNTYLPRMSRVCVGPGAHAALDRHVLGVALTFVGVSTLYAMAVLLAGERLITAFYGARYAGSFVFIPVLAAVVVVGCLGESFCLGLRVLEEPRFVFVAYGVGALFTVALGTAGVMALGTVGAVAGLLGSTLAFAAAAWILYRRCLVYGRPAGTAAATQ